MSRSSIHRLPLDVVIEVKRRLRSSQFEQIEIVRQGADIAALFEELALIKARETEILAQIRTAALRP